MAAIDTFLAEIVAAQADIEPRINGLLDLSRLELTGPAMAEVRDLLDRLQTRSRILTSTISDINLLIANGYPDVAPEVVEGFVYQELAKQRAEIDAALAKFSAGAEAVSGIISIR